MPSLSPSSKTESCDVLIIGAGPAGLALALSLTGLGLDVQLIDRQKESDLSAPAYDGREIALSLRSVDILKKIGAWAHLAPDEIAPLRAAKVMDGRPKAAMKFHPGTVGEKQLGVFVANNAIRRALFQEVATQNEATLLSETEMVDLHLSSSGGRVCLADGRSISAKLIVGADTRFSSARRAVGITASTHDYAKTMIVTKTKFEKPHDNIAWECFLRDGTLAILPLNDNEASVVQTFDPTDAKAQMDLPIEEYLAHASQRLEGRFGQISSLSERFAYPLVGVFAHKFSKPGFALIGDAAVGMHPITAHGYNLGVQGQAILARKIKNSITHGKSPGDSRALKAFEHEHRKLSAPIYWSTLAIAELSSKTGLPARLARRALIDAGRVLPPARHLIVKSLTQPLHAA